MQIKLFKENCKAHEIMYISKTKEGGVESTKINQRMNSFQFHVIPPKIVIPEPWIFCKPMHHLAAPPCDKKFTHVSL